MEGWEKILESPNPLRVEMLRAFLEESHGIAAVVLNKQDRSYHLGLCELYVPVADAVLAKFLTSNETTAE